MTDAETTAAIKALTHRIRERDAAIRDGEDYPDAEPFALEFLTSLRGRGWRQVEALAPAPKPVAGSVVPEHSESVRAEIEAFRQAAAEATARQREQAERAVREREAGAA